MLGEHGKDDIGKDRIQQLRKLKQHTKQEKQLEQWLFGKQGRCLQGHRNLPETPIIEWLTMLWLVFFVYSCSL